MFIRAVVAGNSQTYQNIFDSITSLVSDPSYTPNQDDLKGLADQPAHFINSLYWHIAMHHIPRNEALKKRRDEILRIMTKYFGEQGTNQIKFKDPTKSSVITNQLFYAGIATVAGSSLAFASHYLALANGLSTMGSTIIIISAVLLALVALYASYKCITRANESFNQFWVQRISRIPQFTKPDEKLENQAAIEGFKSEIVKVSSITDLQIATNTTEQQSFLQRAMSYMGYGVNSGLSMTMDTVKFIAITVASSLLINLATGLNPGIAIAGIIAFKMLYQMTSYKALNSAQSEALELLTGTSKVLYAGSAVGFIGLAAYCSFYSPPSVSLIAAVTLGSLCFVASCFSAIATPQNNKLEDINKSFAPAVATPEATSSAAAETSVLSTAAGVTSSLTSSVANAASTAGEYISSAAGYVASTGSYVASAGSWVASFFASSKPAEQTVQAVSQ